MEYTGCTLEEAIRNATSNPAKVIGISHVKGDLLPGMDADFVILDDSNHVQSTYIAGKLVWSCSEQFNKYFCFNNTLLFIELFIS